MDFTYVPTWSGMAFTAFVSGAFSRRIVGWRTAASMSTELPLDALEMALWTRSCAGQDVAGLVHHSDAGRQGGLNQSSQHLTIMEVSSGTSAAARGSSGAATYDVARPCRFAQAVGASVLAPDRRWHDERGGGCRRRSVAAGRVALVPSRWRHATHVTGRTHRSLPVTGGA